MKPESAVSAFICGLVRKNVRSQALMRVIGYVIRSEKYPCYLDVKIVSRTVEGS